MKSWRDAAPEWLPVDLRASSCGLKISSDDADVSGMVDKLELNEAEHHPCR